jgi:hypothetical protein
MVRAAKLGLGGSVTWPVGWVVGFESAVWRTISIFRKMTVGVILVAYLARLIGGKDLVNKALVPPPTVWTIESGGKANNTIGDDLL